MLMPKKVKYRKQQRGRRRGLAWRGSTVAFGDYGLMALECCWLTARQIEAARVALTRGIKRGGKVWVRVFPDKPITKKPQETRMGKEQRARPKPGSPVVVSRAGWCCSRWKACRWSRRARRCAWPYAKLPIPTRFATRFAEEQGVMKGRRAIERSCAGSSVA